MKEQYTYQDLESFFDQFKRMPEYISLEQVAQIIQHPSPAFILPIKGTSLRLWTILLSTTVVITIISILYFSSPSIKDSLGEMIPVMKEILPPVANIPAMTVDTVEMELQESRKQIRKQKAYERVVESMDKNESNRELIDQKPKKSQKQEPIEGAVDGNPKIIEDAIDGNPYIIDDLSLDELRKLGFDIQHYSVFYRNTWAEAKCRFMSSASNFIRHTEAGEKLKMPSNLICDLNILIRDTLPEETPFSIRIITEQRTPGVSSPPIYYQFETIEKDYYPVYVSTLEGSISGIKPIEDYLNAIDTLVSVILPFSRLNCSQTKDMIFWFHATEAFYNDLPNRYNQLESFISNNKSIKKPNPNVQIVNYDIDRWVSSNIYPPGEVIDGSSFIMELTRVEQEKIGLFRDKEYETSINYYYLTPWGEGRGLGGKMTWVKTSNMPGRDSVRSQVFDTIFKVDYIPKILTDTLGNINSFSTTGKYLQSTLIENDVLIPIKGSSRIYWFSQSDYLWSILPERYIYLRETYQKILFTKSIFPDIDLVKYFADERKRVDMNVEILELSISELENLGFIFFEDSIISQSSVYNDEWIQFRINLPAYISELSAGSSKWIIENRVKGSTQVVNKNNRDWQKQNNGLEYNELIKSPYQGFQFVMITDEEGHELQRIRSVGREEYFKGKDSQYLIPVRVPLDKYFSEYSETKIFWFTPTEAFFDRLPERIKKDLRKDFYSLTENISNSTCTYFEECRSNLDLTEFNIYPNPTKEVINISFNASTELEGIIYLLDIKGGIVNTLESKTIIAVGSNEFSFSLDAVLPGIYLVAVNSDVGIKTGRLIVTE
jgi:hypothetical protein